MPFPIRIFSVILPQCPIGHCLPSIFWDMPCHTVRLQNPVFWSEYFGNLDFDNGVQEIYIHISKCRYCLPKYFDPLIVNFWLTTQDIWCIMIREHKMLFYLTLYKGLIQFSSLRIGSSSVYLTLYKGLIHSYASTGSSPHRYYLTLYKGLILNNGVLTIKIRIYLTLYKGLILRVGPGSTAIYILPYPI